MATVERRWKRRISRARIMVHCYAYITDESQWFFRLYRVYYGYRPRAAKRRSCWVHNRVMYVFIFVRKRFTRRKRFSSCKSNADVRLYTRTMILKNYEKKKTNNNLIYTYIARIVFSFLFVTESVSILSNNIVLYSNQQNTTVTNSLVGETESPVTSYSEK